MPRSVDVTRFYHRWHQLERSMGSGGGLVVDFDMAPAALRQEAPPYADRWATLDDLQRLRADATGYLAARLEGSEAYLRALMGERQAFSTYVRATMGFTPGRVEGLDARAAELADAFDGAGVPWAPAGRHAWHLATGRPDLSTFADDLREEAERQVAKLHALVPTVVAPDYQIVNATEDAYWSNWIDGDLASGVTLRVNTHPRIEYQRFSHVGLAAHEIAGHAVHVAALRAAADEGTLDPALLSLTVHALDAFHMEGLAQAMLLLLQEPDELDPHHALQLRYRAYASDRIDNAQLDVEAGAPIDQVVSQLLLDCPLTKPLTARSSLRDRSRNPLYRTYIHVYGPSRRMFDRARALDREGRAAFLSAMLPTLRSPTEISAWLDDALRPRPHSQ